MSIVDKNPELPLGRLRVMTMNLLSPDHADWDRRRLVLKDGLLVLIPMWFPCRRLSRALGMTKRPTCWVRGLRWHATAAGLTTASAPHWQAAGRSALCRRSISTSRSAQLVSRGQPPSWQT
jgi:hypothetical protein